MIQCDFQHHPVVFLDIDGVLNHIGCKEENIIVTNLSKLPYNRIHSFSTIFVGNSQMKLTKNRKMNSPLY